MKMVIMETLATHMRECIEYALACHQLCETTLTYCLEVGHNTPEHVMRMRDCSQITLVSADFIARRSDMSRAVCQTCADICLKCAEDCASFTNNEAMQQCADACRRCAESCLQMVNTN